MLKAWSRAKVSFGLIEASIAVAAIALLVASCLMDAPAIMAPLPAALLLTAVVSEMRRRRTRKLEIRIQQLIHDMRMPIQSIGNSIPGHEDTCSKSRTISDAVDMLSQIVGDMSGDMRVKPTQEEINVATMILEAVNINMKLAFQHNVKINPTWSVDYFRADSLMLRRILVNLISNAIEHSGGTTVSVEATLDNDNVLITVSDDGVGFKDGGRFGTGLSVVATMSKFMGGSMNLSSSKKGTRIVVSIPARRDGDVRQTSENMFRLRA